MRKTTKARIQQRNQTELLNQFNFHFVNDLIISPETVRCTRSLGISKKLELFAVKYVWIYAWKWEKEAMRDRERESACKRVNQIETDRKMTWNFLIIGI